MSQPLSDNQIQSLVNRLVDFFAGPRISQQEEVYRTLEAEVKKREKMVDDFLRLPSTPLPFIELQKGIRYSFDNAKGLLSDAQLLSQHKRISRSFTLSHCAIEEIGKMAILHAMCEIPRENQKLWAWTWKNEFRNHRMKYALGRANLWTDQLYEQIGASLNASDFEAGVAERLRQLGLYIEFLASDGRWGCPTEITVEMAQQELAHASRAVQRAEYYLGRDLYSDENLLLRQRICGRIYSTSGLVPQDGEARAVWLIDLLKTRQEFFQKIVEAGVLEPIYP